MRRAQPCTDLRTAQRGRRVTPRDHAHCRKIRRSILQIARQTAVIGADHDIKIGDGKARLFNSKQ